MDVDQPSPESVRFGGGEVEAHPKREPILRAPWPPLLLAGVIVVLYALQTQAAEPSALIERFGFSPEAMQRGHWGGLITALFVHGNWTHAILNALFLLAFGTPVARLFGTRAIGAGGFFTFYFLCGALSSLGFAAVHPASSSVLVGASGAIAGLMAASSRLIERRGVLSGFTSRPVLGMAAAWVAVNLVVAVIGLNFGGGDMPIAWEAHLVGYAVGLFLIGPVVRIFAKADRF
ncbi:MAG: rhomboid family intramembrane serine protease [Caulobacteraceae bacterium]